MLFLSLFLKFPPQDIALGKEIWYRRNLAWKTHRILQKPEKEGGETVYCEWRPSSSSDVKALGFLSLIGKVMGHLRSSGGIRTHADSSTLLLFSERAKQKGPKGTTRVCPLQSSTPQGSMFQDQVCSGHHVALLSNSGAESRQNALKKVIFSSC